MSLKVHWLSLLMRTRVKPGYRKSPTAEHIRARMAQLESLHAALPAGVDIQTVSLDGVATERLAFAGATASAAVLFIHGGGFVGGSPRTHRPITWRLAMGLGVPVYAVDYRLAPQHPYPAALDDCFNAYRALLARGIAPSSIVVAGDSVGGNLALALALRLKRAGAAQPAGLVCLSALTDAAFTGGSIRSNRWFDAVLVPELLTSVVAAYCPGADLREPFISPLYGDLNGLPPTLFHVGGTEILRDDSQRIAAKMSAAGVDTTLKVWPFVWHVWHLHADHLPEGAAAMQEVVQFARARLESCGPIIKANARERIGVNHEWQARR